MSDSSIKGADPGQIASRIAEQAQAQGTSAEQLRATGRLLTALAPSFNTSATLGLSGATMQQLAVAMNIAANQLAGATEGGGKTGGAGGPSGSGGGVVE